MGKHFGNLQFLKGVTYYVLSPYELKPFKGMLNPGLKNTVRRFTESAPPIVIPFTCLYLIVDYAIKENHKMHRKNPDDYKDDV